MSFTTKVIKKGICPVHNCQTLKFEKGESVTWWGHKTDNGWCNADPEEVQKGIEWIKQQRSQARRLGRG